jgi:hypothetical protein
MEEFKTLDLFECGICYSTTYESFVYETLLKKAIPLPCCNYSIHMPCLIKCQKISLLCPFCKRNTDDREFKVKFITFSLISPEKDNDLRLKRISSLFNINILEEIPQNFDVSENTKEKTKLIFLNFYNNFVAKEETKKTHLLSLYKKISKINSETKDTQNVSIIESFASEISKVAIFVLFVCGLFSTAILPVYWT